MSNHEYFESLCGRVTGEQVSPEELTVLLCHIMRCKNCRNAYGESLRALEMQLGVTDSLPELMLKDSPDYGGEYRKRFLDRALAEGFRFSESVEGKRPTGLRFRSVFLRARYGFGLAALFLVVVLGIWAYRWKNTGKIAVADLGALRRNTSVLERANDQLRHELSVAERRRALLATQFLKLSNEVSRDRRENSAALARIHDLQQELDDERVSVRRLELSLEASHAERKALDGQLHERERSMSQMNNEIQKIRVLYASAEARAKTQEAQTEKLAAELKTEATLLDHESRLLAADRDVRDLMGARNLRVVDVYDADSEGKNKKAFGRVFYTEGKSLIFYAFDLANPNSKFSFVGWGTQPSASGAVKELGIFYEDDTSQRRWVLKIDNPEVLREINAVFVTLEPTRGSNRPTGQKLLYAYLETEANHP